MPTYGYTCENCGHAFEEFQSITAEPLRKCPICKKLRLKRLIGTGAAIIFKGSGFYATDYRSDSYKTAAKSESGAPGKSAEKKETKPESAPAATESAPKTDKPAKKKSA
jgi:putative FmdB family regulatory protein